MLSAEVNMKRREDADNNCERDKELRQGKNVKKKERERVIKRKKS